EFPSKDDPAKNEKKSLSVKPDNEIKEETGDDLISPITPAEPTKLAVEPEKKDEDEEEPEVDAEGQLTIDVYQTDKDIVIKSTIAGVKPEDLDVDINSEMVTVKGKRTQDEEADSENYYYQECYWGPFSRSIILPVEIVTEKAEATMKNGILTIRLPKMEVARSRKLQVRGF
ncbi:MAG: Hsp20/alpha crystallin family protein, partial [Candidatus Moranbacteria bacterium]|nr:Hsp20/alpha crystallin family protein [Candidatus Moranbacteria bacterium]